MNNIIPLSQIDFEKHIPTAIDPSGNVFNYCQSSLEDAEFNLCNIFGKEVVALIAQSSELYLIQKYISAQGFADAIHLLDLTLTANGFAVTSTEQQAPASKERVAALRSTAYNIAFKTLDKIIQTVYVTDEWFQIWKTSEKHNKVIKHFFFSLDDMTAILPIDKFSIVDNEACFASLSVIDSSVSTFLSNDLLCYLNDAVKNKSASFEDLILLRLLRRAYTSIHNKADVKMSLSPVLNYILQNLDKFPAYSNSSEYKSYSNTYENKKDDSIFVF